MKIDDLIAIDVHTHVEVSCRQPADALCQPFEDAANTYFKVGKRPTIAEAAALLPGTQDRPRGRTKHFPSAFTNPTCISIHRAGAPSTFPPS
jgi:hypothetical protein